MARNEAGGRRGGGIGARLYAVREALARERAEAPRLEACLAAHPPELQTGRIASDPRYWSWGLCERLLERSAAPGESDPREAARLADLALAVAERLVDSIHPAPVVGDLTARCWASAGAARRAQGDLAGAAEALAAARRCQLAGTGDPLVEAAVLELAAALAADQGRAGEAAAGLRRAASIYLETRQTDRLAGTLRLSARLPRRLRAAVAARARRSPILAVCALALLLAAPVMGFHRAAPRGAGGAIASADPAATAVGLDVLRHGGNAADAAVATALALAVVYPEAGNLGGGGFAVARLGGEVTALDFRETAPAAARRGMFLDARGEPVPGASLVGPLAAGVPGSPAGLWELHRRLGKLSWARLVEPARRLAAEGFVVGRHLHDLLGAKDSRELLSRFPETARLWLPGGQPPAVGSRLRLPDLAATLAAYAERGPAAVAGGPVAAAVEAASRRHGGVLTAADLAAYRPLWRPPLSLDAFGWRIAAMPLPSSGGILVGQTLAVLERLGWARLPRYGADRAHLLAEAFRGAFADRFLLGDPATTRATAADLLSAAWIARRAAGIDPAHARRSRDLAPWPGGAQPAREGTETTHVAVIDAEGGIVSLTTTLDDLFGCGLYVPGAGFFLNDEMDDFSTAPGRPNLFQLIQGEANAVAPGKRMLSSMGPLVAWRGGEELALGGRGGSRIPTHAAQALLNLFADGDSLAAALGRPRIHHQWLPDQIEAEEGALSPETRAELERRGHKVLLSATVSRLQAAHRLPDGRFEAASDPRDTDGAGVVLPEPQ